MLTKFLLLFLAIGHVLTSSSFFEDGQRAEIFEITDNEVPTFRITLSDQSFTQLKAAMQSKRVAVGEIFDNMGNEEEYFDLVEFEKVKNATMVVEINNTEQTFEKVHFDLGGSSARSFGRQGFNIKIKDKQKDLYGRTQFRLRSDPRDPTTLRSKLSCDMLNRIGIPSISANFAILYVNGEYFGFYVLMDAPKTSWIEQVFGEKDTPNLYKCKVGGHFLTEASCAFTCENENDDVTDRTEWIEFLKAVDNAQTVEELEEVFDVDQFMYIAIFDYLVGAWDHFFHSGHNFSMYKNKDTGKWMMLYYDFDADIGQDVIGIEFANPFPNPYKDFPTYNIRQWFTVPQHVVDLAIWNNLPRFESKLAEFIENVFNPAVLYPHIDELKEFIRPFIEYDRSPDENGHHPGILNLQNPTDYSIDQWDANIEFTTVSDEGAIACSGYGIKYWILQRYRTVCKNYNLQCDQVYMDENYEYPINKEVEGVIDIHKWDGLDWSKLIGGGGDPTQGGDDPIHGGDEPTGYKCIAEILGYPCCAEGNTHVYYQDVDGDWGYNFEAAEWCGITPYDGRKDDEVCWSQSLGYPCCKSCYVYETDDDGSWGYEGESWCGTQSYCS